MLTRTAAFAAAALMATTTMAQTPAPTPAAKAPAAKTTRASMVRTAKSLDCSKQADAQNVHGKPRKAFMAKCKKA